MKEFSRKFRGHELFWLESLQTDKPTIVFLHGFPDDAHAFDHQFDFFKEKYSLIAPFFPGIKREEKNTKDYLRPHRFADCLMSLLDYRNLLTSNIFIVSHDLGTCYAEFLGKNLGNHCGGVIYMHGMGFSQFFEQLRTRSQLKKSWYMFLFQTPYFKELIQKTYPQFFLNLIYNTGGVPQSDCLRQNSPKVFSGLDIYKILFRSFIFGKYKKERNSFPAYFLWGDKDRILDPPDDNHLKKYYQDYELKIINGNHWMHRTKALEVNQLLEEKLNRWMKT